MGLNRIYKVIWSKTKGCYVVVSEMAKRVGRNKAKAIVISTAAMSMAVAVAPAVMNVDRVEASVLIGAADGTTISANNSTVSNNGIIIGGAISKAADESVIIGDNSGSMGSRNVVIGTYASAGYDDKKNSGNPPKDGAFNQSVAIGAGRAAGEGARAYGDQSIAIGSNTIARGNSSIAIGNDDVDKTDEIETTYTDLEGNTKTDKIGNAYKALTGQSLGPKVYQDTTSKEAAVAIGVKAVAGDISLALGTGANADRVNAVAIGSGATATRDNAVAIGGGATTEAPGTKEVNATINDLKFTWAGGENTLAGDVVSFGKKDYERQLKHVAAGKVSETSTDAINGSQFYGVLKHLTADPVYFYGADDSTAGKIEGVEAAQKSADALKKKVVAKSMADSRLNLLGGADKEKLSDNNIGVTYENTSSIRFRLSKELAGLTSAEFNNTAGDVTTINGDGVTITPVANGKKPVSVTKNGLNNGGNVIANVAGNLEGAKPNSAEPTTNATAPNNASTIKNNAATVGDVLQAGWNLQNNSEEKDFVKPYDTVDFVDGNGTTAVVDTTDNRTSTVKYDVNLGNGLEKNSANKITIKPADKSLEVNKNGVKVKTDGTTITTDPTNGLTVVTGGIEDGTTPGTVKVTDGDNDKIATVDSVVNAVNNAAFTLKASADGGTLNANSTAKATGELIKAGSTIEMIAGKNLEVKHNKNGKITFATVENPSFNTVQIGDEGPKFSATSGGNISVSDKDGTNPVKITNVKDGDISKTSTDAINGSQFHAVAKNTIKLAGQNGTDTATETAGQELDKQGGIKFTVKSSDGKLLDITADANGDTITITPKTGTITTTDGVPTAVTTNGKLVTVDEVVKALKDLGWKATAGTDGTGSMIGTGAAEELIKAGDTVTFKAGNNLSIKQDGKNFIYSLNPALTGLTSAEFKDGDNKVKITPTGITITKPAGTTENTVTLNQNGLNNGGNPITNVAGNLQGAKAGTDAPTTNATAPTLGAGADEVNKNNAATVGDVLNAGWNLQEKGVAKDFVKPYDTVNFIDGDGTSVAVATTNDGRTSTVKYSVNLGNGLEKTTDNKITVTPADKSLEVTTAGLKAKTDNTTITTGDSGLKVVTGGIEAGTTPGTMKVTNGDTGKIATVDSVVDAVNSAAFTLKASAITGGTRNTGSTVTATGESIKAGNTIEMIAGKNLDVTHNTNGKIIFATVENPSFNTVQIGNSEGPKFSATADGNIKVSDKDDTKPVKITNVADGTISDNSKDAINGSQIHKLVNKAIKLAGQNGSEAAGETEPQTLTQQDPIKFTVKSSDGSLLQVEAAGSTITLTPKTGTITTGEDGIPTANTTGGKLVTADNLVKALTEMGWKATAGTDGTGTMIGAGATEELIKSGNTVTFKAGDNLAIKQDSKNFIYSLKTDLTGLTSAEFKDGNNNAVKITPNGVSFKKPNATDADTVTLNQNGLNNGGNPITNVAGNLQGAKAGTDAPTTNATAPSLGTGTDQVNKNNAATVGDVLNAGWNLQNNDAAKDFVKPYDTVNFVDGEGTTAVVETTTDQATSKIKYNVNTGKGLEKTTDNKITVKPGDKSLEVSDAGVAVKKADQSLEVTDDGLKVKTDNTTIKTGDTGLTVNTGTINKVTEGNTAGTVVAKTGDENKIATVSNVVEAINNAAWTATSAATSAGELGATATNQLVKAGDKVTFEADKNIKITQAGSKFTFTTRDDVSFNTVQIGGNQGPKFSKTDAGDIKVSGSDNTTPVKITNVQDGDISADSKDAINGSQFHAVAKNKIKLAGQNGTDTATETDEQELDKKGGIKFTVKSSDGTLLDVAAKGDTITLTPKTATITTGKDGVPTANTDDGKLVTADQLVTALKEMGWKATADKDDTGTVTGNAPELIKAGETVTFKAGDNLSIKQDHKNFTYSLNPALTGLTSAEFKDAKNNTVNITPEGITITKPADPTAGKPENTVTLNQNGLNNGGNAISNVKSNLPDTKNSDTTTGPNTATKSHAAPTLGTSANEVNPANAATVGDVLNAGWNLQGNGTEVDFVKPYDTVNFVNGVNTTAVVSTVDGKTSNVTYNVTGLPITYTDKDGNLVSKIGDEFYKVNEKGQPLDAKGNPSTKVNKDGKPVDDAGKVIDPINTTNNPVKTSLVNPAPETNKTGTTSPTTLDNVTSKLENYKADPVNGKEPAKNSLRDLTNTNVTNDTVATVGDIRNMGWIVSSDKTTGANGAVTADEYSEAVKNANEVRFVGEGSAIVSGKTAGNVRTITVKVDNQTGTNKTVTPVNYTKADGTKVYPQEVDNGNGTKTVKFFENPDGSGKEIPKSDVVTSINGPEGTKNPATLKNVKNNIPNVNDGSKTITDTDGNETAGDVTNINKAPLTAEEAAALANPKTKEGQTNPKYIGNNAATVSDVLNAGWNLQGNGAAKDFVKPYDTVNFVNGLNTTAVVTTSDDGTTSNVTYNVTGLPVTYTTTDGTPVTKIGDKYYKVNDQGQPVDGNGAPVTKFNKDGKPLDANGHEVPDVDITNNPLTTSVVNAKPATDKTSTTSPTTLSNVEGNLDGAKTNTIAPITNATAPNTTNKDGDKYINPNNAATVGDVLNAGWNLQNNGAAKDFVKPFDTVNFVNGLNTTAVVTTSDDGKTSNITYNVTGLPVTYATADGTPVSKIGDKFYKVNAKGQPVDGQGNPSTKVNNNGEPIDGNGNVITPIDTTANPLKTSLVNPTPGTNKTGTTSPTTLDNVTSKLENYKDAPVNGKDPVRNSLVNLSKPENGQPNVSDNTVATVGDLRNMGWIVSSNKTTGENGAVTADEYSATVKNANEVKFVGEGTAIVSGKTEGDVRTITVKVDDQTSTNNAVTPVVYTKADGTQVYPTGKVGPDGNQIFNTKPDGKGEEVTGPVKTTINGPKGTNSPTSLNNVKNNIPNVNDGSKTITDTDGNETAGDVTNINKAPLTAEEAAALANPKTKEGQTNPKYIGNNAATVSDVLNAGWNLQNNGTAKDFVKPYDTVNFRNGGNTTVSVTTDDNLTSHVQVNVTGLPVSNTITDPTTGKQVPVVKVGDAFYRTNPDGTPDIARNDKGEPTNGYVRANDGKLYPRENVTVTPPTDANGTPTITPNTGATPTTVNTNLVNPNVDNTTNEPGNNVSTPNQLGNVANGANTFNAVDADGKDYVKANNGKYYEPSKVNADGSLKEGTNATADAKNPLVLANDGKWYPADKVSDKGTPEAGAKAVENPLAPKNATGEPLVQAKDGKWYKPSDLQPNGTPTPTAKPQDNAINNKAGLVDFSNSNPNNVATIGDLQNMGWVVSAQGNSYSDQVRNTNEVKFVGEGTAIVTGKTDDKGVRTITVKVDDQVSTNNSVTPVVYIDKDGKTVYPIKDDKGNVTYHTTPDGKGPDDKVISNGDVNTSINGPKDDQGNTRPASLSNVKNNIPAVNDENKTITDADGKVKPDAGNVENINKAPMTAKDAADLLKPMKDGVANPKFVGNNAATVSDVLNAGWNLQNNGAARDFVKPFDTVNFVNGVNTTAVVTTSEDGTTSNVTYNVTGLPVTYTTADGTPVSKIGDKYYKVNDKGQPIDEQGNPSTKVNNNGEPIDGNGNVINAIDTAANPLKTSLVNPAPEANKTGTTSPTTLDNVTSKLANYSDPDVNGKAPVRNNLVDLSKPENGQPNVSDNTVATVGDLRNMGWIVSSNKTTDDLTKDYSDTVKNANEVKFVGEGTAIVSGKTDDKGVRTITVKVDDQVSTNNSVTPVNYTKADGTKVYPKMVTNPDTGKEELKFFENPDGSGAEVPKGDVVTSINGPEGTTSPTTLKNVKNNIPNVNDGSKTITNPDGTEKAGDVENINKAPLTAEDAAKLSNPKTADGAANPNYIGNNAATVSDVLNAGWNLQNNGESRDFVKPYDTVNFINGLGTTAVVTTREGNTTSDVTFNVKAANGSVTVDEDGVKVTTGEMKPEVGADNKETGAIATPVDPTTAKQLKDTLDAAVKELATAKDALKTAETALAAKPNDPALQKDVEDKKAQVAEKQTPVNKAQKAHDDAGLNKVATVQNVAEAINNSGFNLKTSADGGEKLTTGSKNDGELIKPGNTVEMVAGNNLTVKQDEHGKITYATKDDVTFKTVDTGTLNVGSPNTYTDGKGNTYTKVGENYYKPADVENGVPKQGATPVDVTTTPVTPVSPVTMKAEAAKPATNNATDAQPSSALNVTSKDGKPTQITGVGSTLNTKSVDTTPAGTEPGTTPNTTPTNLVDLEGTKDAPVNKNAAATVGDLQNMGWVVSAKDGNGYKDVVKNANVVDFKGDQGVTVTGKTLADGTREITVGIKEGEVTNKVTITHGDGSKTDAVKIGDNYYKVDKDGKPVGYEKGKDGKPAGTPLNVDPNTDKVTNAGAGVVTGNAVANAIQDSGWNVGIGSTDKDFSKDAKVYDKVNPNDDVKFANGANTNVSMVTVDALNEDGTKKATTYVKVDINRDLKIDSVTTGGTATDKNGNNLVKVGDQYYKEGDVTIVTNPDGTTTVTPKENAKAVPPADVIPAKDGAMIVKNADGKDVVSATVGKDGNGAFGINGKDGKNGISMTAKDGQGTIGVNGKDGKSTTIAGDTITIKDKDNNATNIGVNTITLVDKAGNTTTTTADKSEIKDAAGNINTNTATGNTLKDPNGNTHTSTASTSELKDKDGNTNASTPTTNVLKDTNGNTNTSAATGTTYKDKDDNKTVVGPKEINISDKSGENTASLTNKDLLLNAKDPNTGVDKTSHVSGDKIAFTTTDEMEKVVDKDGKPVIDPATGKQKEVVKMEKVFDKDGKPVIDPATGKQKEVVKNPGNSTEYTNEGLKVIPNSTVARDVNGNPTFLDKDGKPVMKDTDGKYKYVGQDGKPGDKYDGAVGVLKPNVVDNTRVISFGMDKPVLDKNGKPVTGPDGNPVMTEGISAGMQQIHNVAPGTKDTDGVNVSQLRGTTININNRMNRMGAQAAALAGLQSIQYDPLEPTQISAGLGHYKGSSALALGVNHFKNESTMFHMGASYNGHGDETMMNASVTWKFGARADETAVKDTFRQGPISSAYTLQDKVSALEAQNKIQKDQLEELKALNEKQQEQIAELFKRLIEKA